MKIILKEEVENLGEAGEIVEVADGYGRNYLIPQGLAEMATEGKIQQIREKQRARERRKEERRQKAQKTADELSDETFEIAVKAGEQDRLFGSVTTQDIEEVVAEAGYNIDRRDIEMEENIKELGEHTLIVKLFEDVTAEINLEVVPREKDEEQE
ncbi:50S ribosomal protein L9 [Halarsenatibacter silvermanii]|uniref:Large ribosomal subunit protein bL9 n=1 Tax=Halarsenatibacter silvermanii TaxID=321763 RepID=A0A1G9Q536_9FIRM|nr:50S ribosomal protein L9 [Halarsenatibacter silvermanii]SDM05617.1 large subunit ribosomal protein L9 [Halarsenatibacter silvermanii]